MNNAALTFDAQGWPQQDFEVCEESGEVSKGKRGERGEGEERGEREREREDGSEERQQELTRFFSGCWTTEGTSHGVARTSQESMITLVALIR